MTVKSSVPGVSLLIQILTLCILVIGVWRFGVDVGGVRADITTNSKLGANNYEAIQGLEETLGLTMKLVDRVEGVTVAERESMRRELDQVQHRINRIEERSQ